MCQNGYMKQNLMLRTKRFSSDLYIDRAMDWMTGVRFLARAGDLLLKPSRSAPGPTSYSMGTRGFSRCKATGAGGGGWLTTHFRLVLKSEFSYISTFPVCLYGCYRDKLTIVWFFPLGACELIHVFVCKGNHCNNYTGDIRCHYKIL
jgi:hypothetical protein